MVKKSLLEHSAAIENYTLPLEAVIKAEQHKKTPEEQVDDFCEWARQNPEGIRAMYRKALYLASRVGHVSVKYLFEWLRYESMVPINGSDGEQEFKVSNVHTPIFARYLAESSPVLAGAITRKKSMFDSVDLPSIWRS